MQKKLLLGFALGLSAGAVYHYTHKNTPTGKDDLYRLVAQANEKIQDKVKEAQDPDSDLHANIDKVAQQVKDTANTASAKVKEAVNDTADKTTAKVTEVTDKAQAKTRSAATRAKSKASTAADKANEKVQNAADSAT